MGDFVSAGQTNSAAAADNYFNSLSPQQVPNFVGQMTDANGNLLPQYKIQAGAPVSYNSNLNGLNQQLNGIQLNKQPLQNLEDFASSTGPSTWAQLQQQINQGQTGQQLGAADTQAASGLNQAYSQLGTQGGLSSGARERLAMSGGNNLVMAKQGVQQAGNQNNLGILATDASNKLQAAEQLPGMEVQSLQPQEFATNLWAGMAGNESNQEANLALQNRQYDTSVQGQNINDLMQNNQNQNTYNLGKYNTQMGAWAANQQANATAAAKPKK